MPLLTRLLADLHTDAYAPEKKLQLNVSFDYRENQQTGTDAEPSSLNLH